MAPPPATTQFEAARTAAAQRSATNLAAAESAAGNGAAAMRAAMGRTFVQDAAQRWTDTRRDTTAAPVAVAPFSPAYFALLRAVPALAEAFALGETVIVGGIEVRAGGRETLTDAEVARLARTVAH